MEKIIVPTDFSSASKDALVYAINTASYLKHPIEVIHVYAGSYQDSDRIGRKEYESLIAGLEDFSILEEADGVVVGQGTKITYKAIVGDIEETLIDLSKDPDTALIVMGMKGQGISKSLLFGSTSEDISQKAQCPVLLVPKGKKYAGVNNVLYASDYGSIDKETLQDAVNFVKRLKATLHFVHINETKQDKNYNLIEDRIFNFLFKDKEPDFAFNLLNLDAPTVIGGLNQYISENDIDLLIMVSHQRNFFANLFFKSTTKEMAHYTNTPMLVYHAIE